MTIESSIEVDFRFTANLWDAPLSILRRGDGTTIVARAMPDDLDDDIDVDGVVHTLVAPHAVVLVDGELSAFDAARQPPPDVWWRQQGYVFGRPLDDLGPDVWVVVALMIYNWRLMVCTPDSIARYWCYPQDQVTGEQVVEYARDFDGVGDPPSGWVKTGPFR